MRVVVWPGHAYLPGRTEPHPGGLFAALHATVGEGMTAQELGACDAWHSGVGYLRAGFFWEAREVWIPVCRALPAGTRDHRAGQAAVLLARAGLCRRLDQAAEARALCHAAEARLRGMEGCVLSLPISWFARRLAEIRDAPARS